MWRKVGSLCVMLVCFDALLAQSFERHEVVVPYFNSFINHIEWSDNSKPFDILVISKDKRLIEEFEYLSKKRKVNGRTIRCVVSTSAIIPSDIDAIYVSSRNNQVVRSIYDQIEGHEILLVTDGYQDLRFIMINFIETEDQTLDFEINTANIINQGLKVKPDMVLLGGTEVDVAKLYKAAQDSVRIMENSLSELETRYDSITSLIKESYQLIDTQAGKIAEQNLEIVSKQEVITWQSASLDSLLSAVDISEKELGSLTRDLLSREMELGDLQRSIQDQSIQLEQGRGELNRQQEKIARQDSAILERENSLEEMITLVNTQQDALLFLILFLLAVVISLFLIYRAYSIRKRDAKQLAEQKEELRVVIDELNQTQIQLVQSEKMASLGLLTAGIAHEINNAINFVYSGIHIIEAKFNEIQPVTDKLSKINKTDWTESGIKELLTKKDQTNYDDAHVVINKMIESVQIGAERTTEIVKGLRNFSRTDDEQKSKVDIHEDLSVALLLLKNKYKDTIEITTEFDDAIKPVSGFQGQLGQAFLNIINNALDAVEGKEGGTVSISTRYRKRKIEVTFKDNGTGIDAQYLDRIFDPFFTTKGVGAGTGLGLSITYGIIEKHGGTIEVDSRKDIGTEFKITLPSS